jgi:hypothetical protein
MNKEARSSLLELFDKKKDEILNLKYNDITRINKLYCQLLEETKKITGKYQYVNTSKLMNLFNQKIPLFDNNVIHFFKKLDSEFDRNRKEIYLQILKIYEIINNENKCIPNILKLKDRVYGKIEIENMNLNKFVDTLLYYLGDTTKLESYKKLCKYIKRADFA